MNPAFPSRTRIKICGITREQDLDAAVVAGADAVGFVRYARSPRAVSLALMRHLYLADLVQLARTPAVPGDVKRAAEDNVASRARAVHGGRGGARS